MRKTLALLGILLMLLTAPGQAFAEAESAAPAAQQSEESAPQGGRRSGAAVAVVVVLCAVAANARSGSRYLKKLRGPIDGEAEAPQQPDGDKET